LQSLSEQRRYLLGLAFFQGLSHQEIADATRMPLGTVKSHLRRALAALQGEFTGAVHAPISAPRGALLMIRSEMPPQSFRIA
jgi:RNA polymerase sigma-70 factor (ECF subfamily)